MSFNVLDMLQGLATPALARSAASALGESEGGIAKALGAAFPAILAQMANGAGDEGLMGKIAGMVGDKLIGSVLGSGGGILSQAGSVLSAGSSSPLRRSSACCSATRSVVLPECSGRLRASSLRPPDRCSDLPARWSSPFSATSSAAH